MKKWHWVLGACFLVALFVFANPGVDQSDLEAPVYGFSVKVLPDEEFDDFMHCGMSVFTLVGETGLREPPSLRMMAGDSNTMKLGGLDRMDVTFTCGINAAMTEATYEIAGRRDGQLVLNHLATIRLQ